MTAAAQPIDLTSARVRLTQPERVAAMRARLLDATIDCLVEKGYAAMSTNDVVRRAGVSRGALAHHFPTKAELVSAAADHLVERQVIEYRKAFRKIPARNRTVAGAIDLLWSFCEGPTFAALLELIVAARTNEELRLVFADGPERIGAAVLDMFGELFPEAAEKPMARQLVDATVALLAGLALQSIVDHDRQGRHLAVRQLIKSFGGVLS